MSRTALLIGTVAAVALVACRENPTETVSDPLRPSFSVAQSKSSPVVNSTADDGDGTCTDTKCTLRDAIAYADPGATITLAASLTSGGPAAIALDPAKGHLSVAKNLTITGPGANQLAVTRSSGSHRIFAIVASSIVSISGLAITNGSAPSIVGDFNSAHGSGIYNAGTLHLSACIVANNIGGTSSVGGGLYNDGTLTIDRCIISNNNAVAAGAIANEGSLTITNSTLANNTAFSVAGIINNGTLTVEYSTITGNTNSLNAAGIADRGAVTSSSASATVRSSIVAGNSPANCGHPHAPLIDGGYNIDGGTSCGFTGTGSLQNTDPKLDPAGLADNGGPTKTFALVTSPSPSPAIDGIPVGTNGCGTTFTVDQRGFGRPTGTKCDIGAFESGAVLDQTPPVITPSVAGTQGLNGWYTSDVTVSWTVTDPESAVTSPACAPTTISSDTDTPGQSVQCSATSAGGSSSAGVTITRDATDPTLAPTVSPNPVPLNGAATATPNASDQGSGLASSSCDPVATNVAGAHTVNCTASDNAGNQATTAASYSVGYTFQGFSQPVDNGGTLNVARAGKVIPLKWRLLDGSGLPITTLASVTVSVATLSCSLGTTADALEEYAPGTSGLQNLGNGYYQYNWATPAAYANSCKTLKLDLGDGTPRTASFQFTK